MRASNIAALILLLAAPLAAKPAEAPSPVAAALANVAARTPDNVALDEGRKPAEVLAFFGLKPGMRVLDLFGANKYWAEIVAPAIGPKGHVTVWQASQFLKDERKADFDTFAAQAKNVTLISSPFEAPNFPAKSFDFALINLDYHDVYLENAERKLIRMDPDAWLKTLYTAMKPGATVGVIDHIALPNTDTRATVVKLHRIDPEVVKADFQRAGFELVATSDMLRNPADDHMLSVFDPKIRKKTDRFVFKFRKPR
ncbi:MAG TPA: methyltransferase [Sphingomicrobium sp.]|nr:methyltransferase [Sphingomicrobium sp.]